MSNKVHKAVLIDDSDIDLFIQRRFLEVYDFSESLAVYKSARDALHWLETTNGDAPPDLIFLDLNMPDVDGFTFLKLFDSLPEVVTKKTRIVVLTSSNSSSDREEAMKNRNVIQFITKPLKESDLESLQEMIS